MTDDLDSDDGLDSAARRRRTAAWLADADRDRAEERLARLEGDRALVAALEAAGYQGREYQQLAAELARYGLAVIRAWVLKDEIWAKVSARGFGGLETEPWPGALADDVDGVADETVVYALNGFRDKVLIPGRWDPDKGASLRTFFVGQCLRQFSNVYKIWRRDKVKDLALVDWDEFEDHLPPHADPGVSAARRDELRRAFGKVTDKRARLAFYRHAIEGRSYDEIGDELGVTATAVESMISRARKQANQGER